MCKENKKCNCNGNCGENCNCKHNEKEPLIIGFENEETKEIERYEFLEEFKFKGDKIMAVTLVGSNGKIEFATCNEDALISDFISDPELDAFFLSLHQKDDKYVVYEDLILTNECGDKEVFTIVDEFTVNEKKVYVISLEITKEDCAVAFIKQDEGEEYYLVIDDEEFENLSDIYKYILYENEDE